MPNRNVGYVQIPLLSEPRVTQWLPDELLYSLISRSHVLAGNLRASDTCLQFFDHTQQGSQHDFPSRLDHFVQKTAGMFGDAEEIVRKRTILPFYFFLRSREAQLNIIGAIRSRGIGSLKFHLGILTSRFRAHHPLKMCRQCVFEDKKKFGVPYWHVTHQLPGTWICEEHQCSLSESTVKSNGVGRFLWYLPHQSIMREIYSPPSSETTSHVNALTKIARVSRAIASASCEYEMDSARLLKVYLQRLADVWGTMSIAKLLDTVAPPYAEFAQTMRHIPEFSGMPSDSTQAKAQLARLLRTPRSGVHPLRHVLLITFLFEDWEQFWDMYLHSESRDDLSVTNEIAKEPQRQQIADHKAPMRELLKDLLQKKGYAITRAAKQLGIDTTTAMSWAAQMGISTPRRPKMLTEERHNAIIADLGRGESKDVIAKRYGISVQAVTRTLRTEVGLQQIWLDAKYQVAQGLAREKWMLAIRNNPHCGASGIRLLEPAAYAWLYRHNRAWLSQCMVSMPKSLPSNYHKMDWDSRDRCLAQLVQEAVAAIGAEMSVKRRINLQQIYLQVPELRPMLAQLVRLPLTHKAIHIATSSQKLSNMPDLLS